MFGSLLHLEHDKAQSAKQTQITSWTVTGAARGNETSCLGSLCDTDA